MAAIGRNDSISSTSSQISTVSTGGGVSQRIHGLDPKKSSAGGSIRGLVADGTSRPFGALNLEAALVVCPKHANVLLTPITRSLPVLATKEPSAKRFLWFPFGELSHHENRGAILGDVLNEVLSPGEEAKLGGRHYTYTGICRLAMIQVQVDKPVDVYFKHIVDVRLLTDIGKNGCCRDTKRMTWIPMEKLEAGLAAAAGSAEVALGGLTGERPILIHPLKEDFLRMLSMVRAALKGLAGGPPDKFRLGGAALYRAYPAGRCPALAGQALGWDAAFTTAILKSVQANAANGNRAKFICGCVAPDPRLDVSKITITARGNLVKIDQTDTGPDQLAMIAREVRSVKLSSLKPNENQQHYVLRKSEQRLLPSWPPNRFINFVESGGRDLGEVATKISGKNVLRLLDSLARGALLSRIREVTAPAVVFPAPSGYLPILLRAKISFWKTFPNPTHHVIFLGNYFSGAEKDDPSPLVAFLYLICLRTINPRWFVLLRGPRDHEGDPAMARLKRDALTAFGADFGLEVFNSLCRTINSLQWAAIVDETVLVTPGGIPKGSRLLSEPPYSRPGVLLDEVPDLGRDEGARDLILNERSLLSPSEVERFLKGNNLSYILTGGAPKAKKWFRQRLRPGIIRVGHFPAEGMCTVRVQMQAIRYQFIQLTAEAGRSGN